MRLSSLLPTHLLLGLGLLALAPWSSPRAHAQDDGAVVGDGAEVGGGEVVGEAYVPVSAVELPELEEQTAEAMRAAVAEAKGRNEAVFSALSAARYGLEDYVTNHEYQAWQVSLVMEGLDEAGVEARPLRVSWTDRPLRQPAAEEDELAGWIVHVAATEELPELWLDPGDPYQWHSTVPVRLLGRTWEDPETEERGQIPMRGATESSRSVRFAVFPGESVIMTLDATGLAADEAAHALLAHPEGWQDGVLMSLRLAGLADEEDVLERSGWGGSGTFGETMRVSAIVENAGGLARNLRTNSWQAIFMEMGSPLFIDLFSYTESSLERMRGLQGPWALGEQTEVVELELYLPEGTELLEAPEAFELESVGHSLSRTVETTDTGVVTRMRHHRDEGVYDHEDYAAVPRDFFGRVDNAGPITVLDLPAQPGEPPVVRKQLVAGVQHLRDQQEAEPGSTGPWLEELDALLDGGLVDGARVRADLAVERFPEDVEVASRQAWAWCRERMGRPRLPLEDRARCDAAALRAWELGDREHWTKYRVVVTLARRFETLGEDERARFLELTAGAAEPLASLPEVAVDRAWLLRWQARAADSSGPLDPELFLHSRHDWLHSVLEGRQPDPVAPTTWALTPVARMVPRLLEVDDPEVFARALASLPPLEVAEGEAAAQLRALRGTLTRLSVPVEQIPAEDLAARERLLEVISAMRTGEARPGEEAAIEAEVDTHLYWDEEWVWMGDQTGRELVLRGAEVRRLHPELVTVSLDTGLYADWPTFQATFRQLPDGELRLIAARPGSLAPVGDEALAALRRGDMAFAHALLDEVQHHVSDSWTWVQVFRSGRVQLAARLLSLRDGEPTRRELKALYKLLEQEQDPQVIESAGSMLAWAAGQVQDVKLAEKVALMRHAALQRMPAEGLDPDALDWAMEDYIEAGYLVGDSRRAVKRGRAVFDEQGDQMGMVIQASIAGAFLLEGDPELARMVLQSNPTDAMMHNNTSWLCAYLELVPPSCVDWGHTAVENDLSRAPASLHTLAVLQLRTGGVDAAWQTWRQAWRMDAVASNDDNWAWVVARFYRELGDMEAYERVSTELEPRFENFVGTSGLPQP